MPGTGRATDPPTGPEKPEPPRTKGQLHIAACIAPRFRDLVPDAESYWHRIAVLQRSSAPVSSGSQWNFRGRPKRADELLDGGCLFVIAGGAYAARLPILRIRKHWGRIAIECNLAEAVRVRPDRRPGFRGFRYLAAEDTPPDHTAADDRIARELAALGLA